MGMSAAADPRAAAAIQLARFGPPLLGLLAIEFLLGMALNLFVTLPTGSPLHILESSPLLIVHAVVGVLLLGFASNIVRWSVRAGEGIAVAFSVLGLLSAVLAIGAGFAFAFGDQSAVASYSMSVGFVGLVVEAGYLLRRRVAPAGRPRLEGPATSEG
jgi:hypothetical protein